MDPKHNKTMKTTTKFGTPHASLQIYTSNEVDYPSLIRDSFHPSVDIVSSWFPCHEDRVAFYESSASRRSPLTYSQLHEQVRNFAPTYDTSKNSSGHGVMVVALLMPQCCMAETAVILITLLSQHPMGICVAPLDPNMAHPKLVMALEQLQCTALITTKELYKTNFQQGEDEQDFSRLRDIRLVEPCQSNPTVGVLDWTVVKQDPLKASTFDYSSREKDNSQSPALLLRTSGTTSTPKIVPITAAALLCNATCLAASVQLKLADVGCNAMPLFHIGGISCALLAVLVSGSSVIMMPGFDSQAFCDEITNANNGVTNANNGVCSTTRTPPPPTWYYGVPSMHKALILTAKARLPPNSETAVKCALPNSLRFIRSGAAHLPHEMAVELARVFDTAVIPTYSMSECMPVSSCHDAPIVTVSSTGEEAPRENGIPKDTVGVPIGCSLAILDDQGRALPYTSDQVGEVSLQGPGVMAEYIGLSRNESHTATGWFRSGDMGRLDRNGRLILAGRHKEMIKRGGDQVWPNEVDSVVETVPGIQLAVTFGVPNELWGEEVQVAVVLDDSNETNVNLSPEAMSQTIQETCKQHLGPASVPTKVWFCSQDSLLKGPTGKYLRTKMASYFGAKAIDIGALHALQAMAGMEQLQQPTLSSAPSSALNGVRFLTACFVVQGHIGLMPNNAWLRIQSYSLNMVIFFLLGAFQLVCSLKSHVKDHSAQFIGTKIGAMHALFMVSQIIALGSYLLFSCGEHGYLQTFAGITCAETWLSFVPVFVLNTLTGLFGGFDPVNGPAWFQSAFYTFLIMFPLLDWHLRSCSRGYQAGVFVINLLLASILFVFLFSPEVMEGGWVLLNFRVASWMPTLVAGMIAGYSFSRSLEHPPHGSNCFGVFQWPRAWGVVTDVCSLVLLAFEVIVALAPNDIYVMQENYEEMRPGEPIPSDQYFVGNMSFLGYEFTGNATYVLATDVTHEEFVEYVHPVPDFVNFGRWQTPFAQVVGFSRIGTPLVLLWLFGMAHGHGLVARLMNSCAMQFLAPYAYPLYLLHLPVSRYYWVATRGLQAQVWWPAAATYPVPVAWYELLAIIGICVVLAASLDRFVIAYLSPYTVRLGVWICQGIARCCCCCCCCCCRPLPSSATDESSRPEERTNLQQVERMVKGLTGNDEVTLSTHLDELGLDSLGATALLGTLRASVPDAKSLTLVKLAACKTVGDLVKLLDGGDKVEKKVSGDEVIPPV